MIKLPDYLNGSEEVMRKLGGTNLHELYISATGQPALKLPSPIALILSDESKTESLNLPLYDGKGSELEITFKKPSLVSLKPTK